MKIAVCDDLQQERVTLIDMVKEYLGANRIDAEICEFSSGEDLIIAAKQGSFSLIFLDIYMDGMTGIEAARELKLADGNCAVVFTTTSREHGTDAFDVNAFHYLVKPIDKEKLFSVMNGWYDTLFEARTVLLKCGRTVNEVFIRDILYAEVLGRYCTVHTSLEAITTSLSLTAVEALLPKSDFVRTIRYCLASLGHIQAVCDDVIILDNGKSLPLSRLEKESIRQELASYRLKKIRRR